MSTVGTVVIQRVSKKRKKKVEVQMALSARRKCAQRNHNRLVREPKLKTNLLLIGALSLYISDLDCSPS